MAYLIDKDAVVAEIEKRIKETESMQPKFDQFWAGQISAFKGILKILDTLEAKDANEALRTEYEKGRADAIAKMQKEWSEEDSYNVQCLVAKVVSDIQKGNVGRNNELIDWLKSLKDRITWKPSDEQITVLELASKYERVFTPKQIDILIGLKEQLKKL